jgi:uncharacterized alkaline shock family protein YloU
MTARECYGVAAVGKLRHTEPKDDSLSAEYSGGVVGHVATAITNLRHRSSKSCCRVTSVDNHIDISVDLYLKFGVTMDPVIESLRRAIKYNVETFTGMTVDCVNIDILGIRS